MRSGINLAKIRTGTILEDDYEKVAEAANYVGDLPLYFSNNITASVSEVANEARRLVRKNGVRAIFVDYLQLMPHRMEYATQDLGNIARRFKNLGMSSDITVVLLSQLNRQVESRQDKRPLLSDLRQSGNLEEHADVVMMLYREEMYNPTEQNKGQAELIIRKNRNGPIGMLPMRFLPSSVDFRDIAK